MTVRAHALIGIANPYEICDECKERVSYWHDPKRCNCVSDKFNFPCEHQAPIYSKCPSWEQSQECICLPKCVK